MKEYIWENVPSLIRKGSISMAKGCKEEGKS